MSSPKASSRPLDSTDVLVAMLRNFADRARRSRCKIDPGALAEFADVFEATVLRGIRNKPRQSARVGRRYLMAAINQISRRAVTTAELRDWGKLITARSLRAAANEVIGELYDIARDEYGQRLISPFCFWWRRR